MRKIFAFFLALFLSCSLYADKSFDSIVAFGDSLTDSGNLYNLLFHLLPASPPYYEGRFSNGKVWIEYFAKNNFPKKHDSRLHNYAVGGAEALLDEKSTLAITLSTELLDYIYWGNFKDKDKALHVIWIGGNNYLNQPKDVDKVTTDVVNVIGDSIELLITKDANKFLVVNLPDLSRVPRANTTLDASLTKKLILSHNKKLAKKVKDLTKKYPDVVFVYMDAYKLFDTYMSTTDGAENLNLSDACYSGGYMGLLPTEVTDEELHNELKEKAPLLTEEQWQMIRDNPELKQAAILGYQYRQMPPMMGAKASEPLDCSRYVFWDEIHPTTQIHQAFADYATLLIQQAGLTSTELESVKK